MYVLSLTPAGHDGPTVVAQLEISRGRLRIAELTVRPAPTGTPLPGELADLDFRVLAEQAAAMSTGRILAAPADGGQEPPGQSATAGAVDSLPGKSTHRRTRRASESSGSKSEGVPSDLPKVYWQLGSAAKVADHYDVPAQIARGWIKALRDGGTLPDPWSAKARRRR